MSFKIYHVRQQNIGQTLSAMLRRVFSDKSWGEITKLITGRKVQINGNLCTDEARRLKAGEIVRVYQESLAKLPDADEIVIRFRDEHLMVVEKPPGVTTLRHAEEAGWNDKKKSRQWTLEELLERKLATQMPRTGPQRHPAFRGKREPMVRPVHRLDRDTSGLMIFALSARAEDMLTSMFAQHRVDRRYLAVVHGHPKARRIETHIIRDRGDGLRGSLPRGQTNAESKNAITHIAPIKEIGPYSLIECQLETGRTHQIRIHLSELGHTLCGEKTYTHAIGQPPLRDESGAPRHALHSHKLSFEHPLTAKKLSFEMEWPRDLKGWLKRLEETQTRGLS